MARFYKNKEKNKGLAPGTPVFIGNHKSDEILIRLIDYDQSSLKEEVISDIKAAKSLVDSKTVSWINTDGLEDIELLKEIGEIFQLHPLILEDIVNTGQRPKFEEYDECIFLVIKMLFWDAQKEMINAEQLSLVITENVLLTFQERKGDVFEPVRERIRKQKGRIRATGVDYLAYTLLDTVIDNYLYLNARLGEQIEDLEIEILDNPEQNVLDKINLYKRELKYIRKSIRPVRELVLKLVRSESELLTELLNPFLKDLEDLTTQANEMVDTYTDMLSDYLNMYHMGISNRMNDIMKVLTIFAAIFIPLTFIAGIYGTNFEYLPELHFKYSYFILWGVMIAIAGGMLIYFKRKKWL
jgi:magnesium transporter